MSLLPELLVICSDWWQLFFLPLIIMCWWGETALLIIVPLDSTKPQNIKFVLIECYYAKGTYILVHSGTCGASYDRGACNTFLVKCFWLAWLISLEYHHRWCFTLRFLKYTLSALGYFVGLILHLSPKPFFLVRCYGNARSDLLYIFIVVFITRQCPARASTLITQNIPERRNPRKQRKPTYGPGVSTFYIYFPLWLTNSISCLLIL